MPDEVYWIWFGKTMGFGNYRVDEIMNHYKSPKEIYEADISQISKSGNFLSKELTLISQKNLDEAIRNYEAAMELGYKIITPAHDNFPIRLRNIYGMPCAIYVDGDITGIDDEIAIAVVGTNEYTEYGQRVCARFCYDLAKFNTIIVGGVSIGMDSIAHENALKAGGKIIGVLTTGIDVIEPGDNQEIKEIMVHNGALISEFPPGTRTEKVHSALRNRIMSGISLGVLVIEADEKSPPLIAAGHALTQNKDVFAVPGNIFSPKSVGPVRLIKQGAKAVTCAADILNEYVYGYSEKIYVKQTSKRESDIENNSIIEPKKEFTPVKEVKAKKAAPSNFSETQLSVYECLSSQPIAAGNIAEKLKLPVSVVLATLTELEIYGYANAQAGSKYSI